MDAALLSHHQWRGGEIVACVGLRFHRGVFRLAQGMKPLHPAIIPDGHHAVGVDYVRVIPACHPENGSLVQRLEYVTLNHGIRVRFPGDPPARCEG